MIEFNINILAIKEVLAFGTEVIIVIKQCANAVLNGCIASYKMVSVTTR